MSPPPLGRHWATTHEQLDEYEKQGLIDWSVNGIPRLKKYLKDHQGIRLQDIWEFKDPPHPIYPTQKNNLMLERIIAQSSNEGDYVMDCFCGSGSTLKAAQKLGRKWIGIDKSNVAIGVIENTMGCDYWYYEKAGHISGEKEDTESM